MTRELGASTRTVRAYPGSATTKPERTGIFGIQPSQRTISVVERYYYLETTTPTESGITAYRGNRNARVQASEDATGIRAWSRFGFVLQGCTGLAGSVHAGEEDNRCC